jgi:hypothetical protein
MDLSDAGESHVTRHVSLLRMIIAMDTYINEGWNFSSKGKNTESTVACLLKAATLKTA